MGDSGNPSLGHASPETDAPPIASNVIRLVFVARALRDFGDGFVAVLLPAYLTALGFGPFEIGLISTAALLGSALTTLGVGLLGAKIDHRRLLLAASGLMILTGLGFATTEVIWVIPFVAAIGTINPSSGSVNVFAPLEHALLSRVVADEQRTRMFARYSLAGAIAAAAGSFASASPDVLAKLGMAQMATFKAMFIVYACLGIAAASLYARLPVRPSNVGDEPAAALGPSRKLVYLMAALFSVDSFAGGFAVQSLVALWLFRKFGLSLTEAGIFFFWTGVLSAFSFPVAAWLSRKIGLINTMVFTHMPSSVCLILAAVSPRLDLALGLLLVRAAFSQMDVPTRSSYVMAVVTPAERPAAASVTVVPRSLAAAISPAIAGALFAAGYEALPLVICGILKISYDIGLLWMFRHVRPPEEQ